MQSTAQGHEEDTRFARTRRGQPHKSFFASRLQVPRANLQLDVLIHHISPQFAANSFARKVGMGILAASA